MPATFVKPFPSLPFLSSRSVAMLLALTLGAFGAGCTPEIGDGCFSSTDCSQRGDRLCDIAQPGGYCTLFNCRPNLCPDDASCVLFDPQVPGCGFEDRNGAGGSRVARSACMKACETDADCRGGYVCADPRQPPWNALILDENQNKRSCLVPASGGPAVKASAAPPVCSAAGPDAGLGIDASAPLRPDAGVTDAGAPRDAGSSDAGDAGDAGL